MYAWLLLAAIAALNLFLATVAATFFVGVAMVAASAVQIIQAFVIRKWGQGALWLLSGLFYLLAAFAVFYNPRVATLLLTLVLGVSLGLSGLARLWMANRREARGGRGWRIIASGLCSLAAAVLIAIGWPFNSAWIPGPVLAADLMFQGVALIFVGLSLKVTPPQNRGSLRRPETAPSMPIST